VVVSIRRTDGARPTPQGPADPREVRRHNLGLVARLLYDRGPRSRTTIARETRLTKPTVSSLVTELEERGLVRDVGIDGIGRPGRPATLVELDGRHVAAIGLEVNVDYIAVLVTDLAGRVLVERRRPLDAQRARRGAVVRSAAAMASRAIDALGPHVTTIAGLTVALPGVVDVVTGTLRFAPNLGWRDVPIADHLARALGNDIPISVDNEANLGALAEYRVGAFAGTANLLYIIGEIGVGAGIVVGGQLLRGAAGFTGEVGHMAMQRDGLPCGCGGRGCWETMIGLRPLLRAALPDMADELLADDSLSPEAKVAFVVERAERNDRRTLNALKNVGEWLGLGVANLVNVLNPEVVVLGGFFLDIAPWVMPVAAEMIDHHTVAPDAGGCTLAVSSLGFSAAALGGAIHSAERVFADPTSVVAGG
jgi:predicted NBD/HSP70 family sugar kinase